MAVSQDWARVVELAARAAQVPAGPLVSDTLTRPADDALPALRAHTPSDLPLGVATRARFEPASYLAHQLELPSAGRLHVDGVFGALELAADEELGVDRPALDLALAVTWRPVSTHVAPHRLLEWARGRADLQAVIDIPAAGQVGLVAFARRTAYELSYELELAASFTPATLSGRAPADGQVTVIVVHADGASVVGLPVALGGSTGTTDGHGRVTLPAAAGRAALAVGATGAVPCAPVQVIGDGQTRVVLVRLSPAEAALAGA